MKRKILLTNDDGIYADGLSALEAYLHRKKQKCFISAPLHEKSGAGHSITLHHPLRVKKIDSFKYAIDGTPTDAIFIGVNDLVDQKPDIVISGINRGGNLGNDLSYSGTVAAAVEAYYNNITAVAVSLYITDFSKVCEKDFHNAAALFFEKILPFIEKSLGGEGFYKSPHLINVNIPDTVLSSGSPVLKWTTLGKRNYGGQVIKRKDPRGKDYFWIGGDQVAFVDIPGSDCNAIVDNEIAITPLKMEFTDYELYKKILR